MSTNQISQNIFKVYYEVFCMIFSTYLWKKQSHKFKMRLLLSLSLILLTIAANLSAPLIFGKLVSLLGVQTTPMALVLLTVIAYSGMWLFAQIFLQCRAMVAAKVFRHTIRLISLDLLTHLHKLSTKFHVNKEIGSISTSMGRIEYSMTTLFWNVLFYLIPTLIEVIIIQVLVTMIFSWQYAVIMSIGIVSFIVFTLLCSRWDTKFLRVSNQYANESGAIAIESMMNYELVKVFNNEKLESQRYDAALEKSEKASLNSDILFESIFLGQGIIVGCVMLIISTLAATQVMGQTLSLGEFVALNAYVIRITVPLAFLGYVIRDFKNSSAGLEDIKNLLNEQTDIQDEVGAKSLVTSNPDIKFEKVNFVYETTPILKNISFEIKPGKTVAIVGPSGSGKTTLSRLILRFYDPTSGIISIDEQDIATVTQDSLRQAIGVISQDVGLFNESIRYNIAYGNLNATEGEIIEAAKKAHVHDFIMSMPEGYDTVIGERGMKLSGGERQRLAIARAFIRKSKMFIIDEATSSLDMQTERSILQSVKELSNNITTLMIAHRLTTVVDADEIIVLKKGEIVERGTHQQLLKQSGLYAEMWFSQDKANNTELLV